MNKTLKTLIEFIVVALIVLPLPAVAGSLAERLFDPKAPVQIEADALDFDSERNVYEGAGNVVVTQGEIRVEAGTMRFDMTTGEATATGGVVIRDRDGNTLSGESIDLNINDDTIVVMKGRLYFKEDGLRLTGEVISKVGERRYEMKDASITSCDCEGEPAWSFHAAESDVEVGGYYVGRNASFRVKGVPVLYSPFVALPVKTERQTGLLMSELGYSGLKGYKLDNSFFWAISENSDATLYLDLESRRGRGSGVEYRYIRSLESRGELFYYNYREKDIDRVREVRASEDNLGRPRSAEADRWEFRFKHREDLIGASVFTADVWLLSDDEYFLDLGGSGERSLEAIESNLAFTARRGGYSLTVQARLFDNLLKEDDSDELQKLPEVNLTGLASRIYGSSFFFSSDTSYVNFHRKTGVDGSRLDIAPSIFLPLRPGRLFELTPSFTPRYTRYRVSAVSGDDDHERYIYEAKVDMVTTFVRFYETDGGGRVSHTIRPRLTYAYIPGVDQSALPFFDSSDRIAGANSVTYSLNMTVSGGGGKGGVRREYLYFDLSQAYDIGVDRRGGTRPSSDVAGELRIKPYDWATAAFDGVFDVYEDRFENFSASVRVGTDEDALLDVNYHYVYRSTDYIDVAAGARLTKSLRTNYRNRYSLSESRRIETSYGIEYEHSCWGSTITYTDRIDENLVMLTLSLKGVGEVLRSEYDR